MPTDQKKVDLSMWQAESLRATCFPSPTAEFDAINWWQNVVGEQPENTRVRAREGFRQDEGFVSGRKFVLGVQPIRADWLMVPNEEKGELTIGTFQDSLELYLDLMSKWFEITPHLRRLAFGSVVLLPVDSKEAGYELLGNYLPKVELDSTGISDFLYQINRPRENPLTIPNLQINRLTKWSVLKRGLVNFELSPNAQVALFPSTESLACRLELDINTSADYIGDLPSDKLLEIFMMLIDFAKEIVQEGDIS